MKVEIKVTSSKNPTYIENHEIYLSQAGWKMIEKLMYTLSQLEHKAICNR